MKATRFIASALALGSVMMASAASAQNTSTAASGVQFGIGGGLAMPTGDFGEVLGTGFDIHGMLGFNPAALPFGVRLDVGFNQFGYDDDIADANFRIISGAANALLKIPATSIAPYVLGGIGVYNGKADVEGAEGETKFGLQLGGGLQFNLSGMATHLEAKYVNVFTEGQSSAFIPITFGIMFGGAGGTASGSRTRTR